MIGYKHTITFMDILRLLMFFALYFGPVDSQEDYYRNNPSSVPLFQKVPDNITVQEGELAKLRCRIKNLGPKVVVWRRTDQESPLTVGETTFNPDGRIEIEYERLSDFETRWDLIIKDVRDTDAGIYECQVSSTKIYTNNVTLNVIDPIEYKPEITITGTEYVSLMENIHLTCNATGAMKAFEQVDWFFKGEPIDENKPMWRGRFTELNHIPVPGRSLISQIFIEKATMRDSGNYLCRATAKLTKGRKVHVLNDTVNRKEERGISNDTVVEFNTEACILSCLERRKKGTRSKKQLSSRYTSAQSNKDFSCIMSCLDYRREGAGSSFEEYSRKENCVLSCLRNTKETVDNENKLDALTSGSSVCEKQYVHKYFISLVLTSVNILIYQVR